MSFTKDRSVRVTQRWTSDDRRPAGWGTSTASGGNTLLLTRTRTGESNPNWKTQVRRQQDATTPLTGVFETFEGEQSSAKMKYRFDLGFGNFQDCDAVFHGDVFNHNGPDWVNSMDIAVADNRARQSFYKNARAALVHFSAPTFLGELRETVRMIRHPAQGLASLSKGWIGRVSKEKSRNPRQWKKNLSSMWLEYAFGWTPLIHDIGDAFQAYRKLKEQKPQVPVSGFGIERELVPSRTTTGAVNLGWTIWDTQYKAYNMCFVKYRGMVTRQVTGSNVDKLEPFGFTPEEFFPTAWELLPWSFLIDYFSNIGDVISAGVLSTSRIAWANRSNVKFRVLEGNAIFRPNYSGIYVNGISSSGFPVSAKWVSRNVQRDPGVVVERPSITLELPGHPAQWANMTALFAQANSIHPQRRWR